MKKAIIAVISLCMAASTWSCGQLDQNSSSDIEPPAYLKGEQSPQPELQDSQSDLPADDVQTQPVTEQQETSEAPTQTERISPVPSSTGFPYGLWWANDGSGDSYYFFSDDNCSGSLHSQQTGTGLGFDYEIYGNTAIFHLELPITALKLWSNGPIHITASSTRRTDVTRHLSTTMQWTTMTFSTIPVRSSQSLLPYFMKIIQELLRTTPSQQ